MEQASYFNIRSICGWLEPDILEDTSLLYVTETDYIFRDSIYRYRLAALTDIGRSKAYLPKDKRPPIDDGPAEREADTAYFRSLPAEKRCIYPQNPLAELDGHRSFCAGDHAIASGVRFAKDRIIVVAPPSLKIGPVVTKYAKEQRVAITRVNIHAFSKKRIERFRWIHWVPCPGKDAYDLPYAWVHRFIPPG